MVDSLLNQSQQFYGRVYELKSVFTMTGCSFWKGEKWCLDCTPATSVPSERDRERSVLQAVVNKKRDRLLLDNVNTLVIVFLASNLNEIH